MPSSIHTRDVPIRDFYYQALGKRRKKLCCVICLLISFFYTEAQTTATVSGRIFDDISQEILPFASVVIHSKSDRLMLGGTLSDQDGRFVLEDIPVGEHVILCSFIGYVTDSTSMLVVESNTMYDVGKLYLIPATTDLVEVVISADKATVDAGLTTKTFAPSDQIAQSGGSVLDAMKGLPGITVDQDGNVILRGSSDVTILVDGKRSGMTGFGTQQGLANIPASNIERIEVINNPSAKYDAVGSAGIINIVYKDEKERGFNGSMGLMVGLGEWTTRREDLPTALGRYRLNPKFNPSFNLNYRSSRVNTFLQGEVLRQRSLPNNEFTTRNYFDGSSTLSAVPENRRQTHYIFRGGVDWKVGQNSQLSFLGLYDYENHVDTAQVPFIDLLTDKRYR